MILNGSYYKKELVFSYYSFFFAKFFNFKYIMFIILYLYFFFTFFFIFIRLFYNNNIIFFNI